MRDGRFVLGWIGSIVVANAVAVTAASMLQAETVGAVLLVAALEGCCLGLLQGAVLRTALGSVARRWLLATLAGILIGRGLQFVVDTSALVPLSYRWPETLQYLAAAAAGGAFGAVMAVPQALALRGRIRHPAVWIAARAAGLAAAFAALFASSHALGSLNAGPLATFGLLLGVVAVAALIEGGIEGSALGRLVPARRRSDTATTPHGAVAP